MHLQHQHLNPRLPAYQPQADFMKPQYFSDRAPLLAAHSSESWKLWSDLCMATELFCFVPPLPLACGAGLVWAQWDPSGSLFSSVNETVVEVLWPECNSRGGLAFWPAETGKYLLQRGKIMRNRCWYLWNWLYSRWTTIFVLGNLGICRCDTTTSRPCLWGG